MKILDFYNSESMATISTIRRNNLERLFLHLENQFNENPKNSGIKFKINTFCQLVGINQSTYSQLKNPKHKPYFNEIYARRIEEQLGLEEGWFDINREEGAVIHINFEQFNFALNAYLNFISSKIITVNDEETLFNFKKNLFRFVFNQDDLNSLELTQDDYLELLKKTE